jgi:hypothetical protein
LRIAIAEARLKRAKSWVTGFELRPMR